ncbi:MULTISPECIES: alpha/beta fold hydrolase [Gordonia]|uniref:Alpha/beta hydrolase n=2 Tax=Gordonia TaxID=2053 RepID=A0ABN3HBI5_9ACTN|nr:MULTISPECIES: alpha/beta hydrolase [Gordonia]AUH68570.1 alpha/beta hydrolase [Gordonia sp. YC-JH1]KJR07035.1 alpha/beta hydrolase [Gordonia sihwensis]KXT55997.1 alpha/beta hydrolase [Gordonia sp. QH-12]MBY4571095.1 alpha/beta hydrolase [Gordonia sihwensis]WFN91695.1 alpha/beta hydrolase [Gordonia sihwensis]
MGSIDLPAGPIDYLDTGGDGPVLLFGHGLLMNRTQWRRVIPLLDDFRCIAPTWPLGAQRQPMNASADLTQSGQANIIADFLEALDLRAVTLVLNDWGGGQFIISEGRDERLARLVLASCEAYDNFPPRPARPAAQLCRVPGGTWLLTRLTQLSVFRHGRAGYGGLAKNRIPDAVMDDWFGHALADPGVRRDLRKFVTGTPPKQVLLDWHRKVVSFDRPVLLLWATEDRMMPVEHARRMVDEFPDARLVEIADSWTLLPEDQPEQVAAALREFVGAR